MEGVYTRGDDAIQAEYACKNCPYLSDIREVRHRRKDFCHRGVSEGKPSSTIGLPTPSSEGKPRLELELVRGDREFHTFVEL
jgi:hypothetical protein